MMEWALYIFIYNEIKFTKKLPTWSWQWVFVWIINPFIFASCLIQRWHEAHRIFSQKPACARRVPLDSCCLKIIQACCLQWLQTHDVELAEVPMCRNTLHYKSCEPFLVSQIAPEKKLSYHAGFGHTHMQPIPPHQCHYQAFQWSQKEWTLSWAHSRMTRNESTVLNMHDKWALDTPVPHAGWEDCACCSAPHSQVHATIRYGNFLLSVVNHHRHRYSQRDLVIPSCWK